MITRDEALGNYVKLGWHREEVAGELREIDSQLSTLRAIIFAEQVKPQREPKKGGYQPRGESKRIVASVLTGHSLPVTAKHIQTMTGLSVDQVTEALKQLRKEGYVNRSGTQGRHQYELAIRKENENQDNSNNSIGKLGDVPSFKQLSAGTDDAFNR